MIIVLVPVLNRPDRVKPLVADIAAAGGDAHPYFLLSPGDRDEIEAVWELPHPRYSFVPWAPGPGDYARKINFGFVLATMQAEWILLGADDLHFHEGWADAALAHLEPGVCVIGTNDLGNPRVKAGLHSTHPLVHRDYLECGTIDEPGVILHTGYSHNFCDSELIETAKWRGAYAHADDAIVEHMHPSWHKGEDDSTYQIGKTDWAVDQRLYSKRQRLWNVR